MNSTKMQDNTPEGVLDKQYHIDRQEKRAPSYRLKRRTYEVVKAVNTYLKNQTDSPDNQDCRNVLDVLDVLDIGTADGLMLSALKDHFPQSRCRGLEYAMDLLQANRDHRLNMIRGDAGKLPFQENSFHLVTACAIIEHLPDAKAFLKESLRVLKPNGLLVVTTPVPFWEKMLTKAGHLDDDQHYRTYNLKELKELFTGNGFNVVQCEKFMMSPIGFPLEHFFESIMKAVRLTITLGNQIIVGQK